VKIAVLMGGNSEERDVSLSSGCQVAKALRTAGHDVVAVDTAHGVLSRAEELAILTTGVQPEPPDPDALDLVETGDTTALTRDPRVGEAEVLFLALHGGAGEDGTLQTVLDIAGVSYAGSGSVGCALAMDKDLTKRLLRDAGVPTPEWLTGSRPPADVAAVLDLPVVVKPASGGSSLRLALAHDLDELARATELIEADGDTVLYERYIQGREVTVGILGDEALPVGEIIPSHELFDYECKYQPDLAREIFPADLPEELAERIQRLALQVHECLRLRDFSRVDFMLDGTGTAWCLEANALPGLTSNSLLPKAARAAGIEFPDLCERIARMAVDRAAGRTRPERSSAR
jgi:D-alanine-D-alanine ligase